MRVSLEHKFLKFSGRIDGSNPEKPEFVFPASSLFFRFRGKEAKISVTNKHAYWHNTAGAVVDGVQKRFDLKDEGMTELVLLQEEEDGEHEVLFFKRMDSCHEMVLEQLQLSDGAELLPLPEMPRRRIEVYGDSVSAGEVSEAVHCIGREDPEHQGEFSNSWYSYGWILARKLGAEIHDIAQGGIALMDGTGWFLEAEEQADGTAQQMGMESVWDKVHYHPDFGMPTQWDFTKYIPQVVIVAVGQNDSHPEDFMKEDDQSVRSLLWKKTYEKFLRALREKYPEAQIVCITTLLEHSSAWDDAIEDVCSSLSDPGITHYRFKRNGRGTPGHLRIPEAEEMAEELSIYIDSLDIKGWQ